MGVFTFDKFIAPVLESALGELHDIALVDKGHTPAFVPDGVIHGGTDQSFAAINGNRLDADT